jgi:hypothetical protein
VVLERLLELLQEAYPVSRDATIYSEVVMGEINFKGITELRDVLEHINRALNVENEAEALDNITEAYEHLRRAGVESLQRAAIKEYYDVLNSIRVPNWGFRLALVDIPDRGRVRELRMDAMKHIADGRIHKSNKGEWLQALEDFKSAIDCCAELKNIFPTKVETNYRILTVISVILTAVGFVLGAIGFTFVIYDHRVGIISALSPVFGAFTDLQNFVQSLF